MAEEVGFYSYGLTRLFTDVSLLPDLLAAPVDDWAGYLRAARANQDHIEDSDADDGDLYERMAADVEAFARSVGLHADTPTEAGHALGTIGELPYASRTEDHTKAVQETLAGRIKAHYRGHDGLDVTTLLQNAARLVARVPGGWAGYCPGLLLAEMRHLVTLAHVDRRVAQRLVERLVSTRQRVAAAVDRRGPDDKLTRSENLVLYADAVNAFHLRAIRRLERRGMPSITRTEAVATAILLTHANLLLHLDTLEPVNCLGADRLPPGIPPARPDVPAPILLNDGSSWDPGYSAVHVATLMQYLMNDETDVNDKIMFPTLHLDRESRERAQSRFGGDPRDISNHRLINKGLAMELLTSVLLSRLDSARYVRSYCETQNGVPHRFAGGGLPDVEARYDTPPPGFHVVVAASAKRSVTREFYGEQVGQAYDNGDAAAKVEKVPVYALVLNGGDVLQDKRLHAVFRYKEESRMRSGGKGVTLVPMNATAFALGVRDLVETLPADGLRFDPSTLVDVFSKLTAGAFVAHQGQGEDEEQGDSPKDKPDPDAGRRTWSDVVTGTELPKPKPRRKKKKKAEGPKP